MKFLISTKASAGPPMWKVECWERGSSNFTCGWSSLSCDFVLLFIN